ncbi:uncharacterized protein BXZ73DRAFT_88615 [Epithele typhae]|uniref:uncharacterized protein n=1 Tax=Epithele typhae TaxID=378194 RepID=UPI002007E08B|nr:uncharacterized protein BXZ73DRAFT_88615 [Epithele typhae]KAH9940948.1 hypothetical protein BXZ73DRAFT_88615 [Epithele typhae]
MADNHTDLDPAFHALPAPLRKRIDNAFDSAVGSSSVRRASKRRKLDQDGSTQPGGFLTDEPTGASGGFIVDEPQPPPEDSLPTYEEPERIPLSAIPSALHTLDLQPDDEDVLAVFHNAASGWNKSGGVEDGDQDEATVSRKDWRAVCAALLDPGDDKDEDVEMGAGEEEETVAEEESDSEEEYLESHQSASSAEDDGSSDEYTEQATGLGDARRSKSKLGPTQADSRRASRRKARSSSSSSSRERGQTRLSSGQKEACLTAFALFFPHVETSEVGRQRLRIKDITQAATLLKEKMSAEETIEMLAAFSSSGDHTMGPDDFERMMVAAKLV